jgi:hypothetical protein
VLDEAACDWLAHRLQEPVIRTLPSLTREANATVQFVAVPAG